MATEYVALLHPRAFHRENGPYSNHDITPVAAGDLSGLPMRKLATEGYTTWFVIPANLTMGTGLTLKLPVVDDGADSDDLGKVVRLGITVKVIASGTDEADLDAGAATEATLDVTLDATTGQVVIGSKALTALDSAAVGDLVAIRIRRIGTATQDTCRGRIVLLGCYILNT